MADGIPLQHHESRVKPRSQEKKCAICHVRLGNEVVFLSACEHHVHMDCRHIQFSDISATDAKKCPRNGCESFLMSPPYRPSYVKVANTDTEHAVVCHIWEPFPKLEISWRWVAVVDTSSISIVFDSCLTVSSCKRSTIRQPRHGYQRVEEYPVSYVSHPDIGYRLV
jgi:hypothetical protein